MIGVNIEKARAIAAKAAHAVKDTTQRDALTQTVASAASVDALKVAMADIQAAIANQEGGQ